MIQAPDEKSEYDELVDRWVHTAITNGVTSLNSLIKSLPGVYPTVALESLARLAQNGWLNYENSPLARERSQYENPLSNSRGGDHTFPIEHPLDFDWRFDTSATEYLSKLCLELTDDHDSIAVLGVPSILTSRAVGDSTRQIVFLDNNHLHSAKSINLSNVERYRCDVLVDDIPDLSVSLVLADPPWYPNYLKGFLWFSSKICLVGGHILFSVPPIGTRPGIDRELSELRAWAETLGLRLCGTEAGILPYTTPLFEANALKASGLHNLSLDWRRGDLVTFTKEAESEVPRPKFSSGGGSEWYEVNIKNVRLKYRPYQTKCFDDPRLLSIVKSDIFPTVSLRDPRRDLVDVWTSGNRVFACTGRFVLHNILCAMRESESSISLIENELGRTLTEFESVCIKETQRQLQSIIQVESKEISEFYSYPDVGLAS